MTITLEITPELQAELNRQAALTGRGPEAHAASLLAGAVRHAQEHPSQIRHFGQSLVETCAMVAGLTEDLDFGRDRSTWRPLDLS